MTPYTPLPEFVAAIERACENDGSVLCFTQMKKMLASGALMTRTVVLTTRSVRFIQWAERFGKQSPEITSQLAIPLHEISAVGTGERRGGLFTTPEVSILFSWSGGTEEWFSTTENAPQVIAAIESAVQGKVVADQATLIANAVSQLSALVDDGLITADEFQRAKSGFIGKPAREGDDAVALLRQLYALHKAGVLSEGEFNLKKWDVLSR